MYIYIPKDGRIMNILNLETAMHRHIKDKLRPCDHDIGGPCNFVQFILAFKVSVHVPSQWHVFTYICICYIQNYFCIQFYDVSFDFSTLNRFPVYFNSSCCL
jgi:hypothetical protein